jgi:hypothetical protein
VRRLLLVAVLLAVSASAARLARAEADAKDPAAAEALFKQARALWDAGKKADACAKFSASYELDPAPGTLLNIAACAEQGGKTATAWSQYVESARVFRRRGDERRAAFADAQAASLEPKLAYVVVHADRPVAGLTLTRDGASFQLATLDTKLPVDPGDHEIVAKAPGYEDGRVKFKAAPGGSVRVLIPLLVAAPEPVAAADPAAGALAPSAAAAADAGASGRGDAQRIAAYVLGGTGIASLAVGGVFVGLTADAKSTVEDACPGSVCRTAEGKDALSRANTYANVANGTLIGGAVLLGVGVIVFLTTPSENPPDLSKAWQAPRAVCSADGCGVGWAF